MLHFGARLLDDSVSGLPSIPLLDVNYIRLNYGESYGPPLPQINQFLFIKHALRHPLLFTFRGRSR